jgi:hypothetical protein
MEQEALPKKLTEGKPTKTFGSSYIQFVFILFFYAIVELEFLHRLWALIGSQLPYYYYLPNAIAFEACFISSVILLWLCLRISQTREEMTPNLKNIAEQITILVVMLLLSLTQFSSFTQAYDKIKP